MIRILSKSKYCRFRATRQGFFLLWTLVVVAGCGGGQGKVTGTVNYRGKPLPNGTVSFFDKDNKVVGTSSITDGKYTIRNVLPGSVKITVAMAPLSPPTPAGAKDIPATIESISIPSKYDLPDQSGLTYEIKPGSQEHPIDLN
ncbi:MAG: carboxypeptidase-like regulatory domain-containing protein [Gemmataceae bacterium]